MHAASALLPTQAPLLPTALLADPAAPFWLPREPFKFPENERHAQSALGGLQHERVFLEELAKLPPAPPWRRSWAQAMAHAAKNATQPPCATVFFRHIRKTGGSSLRDLFRADATFEHLQYDLPRARLIARDACTIGHEGHCHDDDPPDQQQQQQPGRDDALHEEETLHERLLGAAGKAAPPQEEDIEEDEEAAALGASGGLTWQLLHNDTFVSQHPRLPMLKARSIWPGPARSASPSRLPEDGRSLGLPWT